MPDSHSRRRLLSLSLLSLLLAAPAPSAASLFSFNQKRFTGDGLIDAGSLGVSGRVAALGDLNGDQFLDVFALSEDQHTFTPYLWDHKDFTFRPLASFSTPFQITSLVPGDFNHDGRLDLLVLGSTRLTAKADEEVQMWVYKGTPHGGLDRPPIELPSSTAGQPTLFDANGDFTTDLLAYPYSSSSSSPKLKLWQNTRNATSLFSVTDAPFTNAEPCQLAHPHSNAFIDLDGDCLADLFFVCAPLRGSSQNRYQIWLNRKSSGFRLHSSGVLPKGAGQISFADFDRDGTTDLIFPTCAHVDSSTGDGKDCSINIAYNRQVPLCDDDNAFRGLAGEKAGECRPPDALCLADEKFRISFEEGPDFVRLPLGPLLPAHSHSLRMLDTSFTPALPVPLRLGDYNHDGYPDVLALVALEPAPGGLFGLGGGAQRTGVVLLESREAGRALERLEGKGTKALAAVEDARSASFVDLDEDGTLDIMVQRAGADGGPKVTFLQNNFFHDAFFLKTLLLNGACIGWCYPSNSSEPRYKPFGVSYPGASYKFTILDTAGKRKATEIGQLPQTSYHSLQTPYAFFGLGRTNNYVENLFVGSTSHAKTHCTNFEGIIPNSQVIITPPPANKPDAAGEWHKELYLHPGDWIPWVTLVVVVASGLLAVVVLVLHLNEKREDERERKRANLHINFQAL